MKKGIIIILTIAILGGAMIATHHNNSSGQLVSSGSTGAGSTVPSNNASISSTNSNAPTTYKDGTYTGNSEDTAYGTVQIAVVVSGGKISDVNFLQMPSDLGHSQEVTSFSEPLLKQTTLQHQSSNIDFVSGATSTSVAYQQSLQSALDKAVIS